jgi:hypothetical protein
LRVGGSMILVDNFVERDKDNGSFTRNKLK